MATRVTAPVTTSTPATKRRHRADGTCPSGKSTGSNVTWSQYGGCRRYHRTLIRHPVRGWLGPQPAVSYDCVMTQPYDVEGLPSPSSALLQLARLKAGMSQRELAERAGVPVTMISAYERDQRQPTLTTLLRLLHAAGFDLRLPFWFSSLTGFVALGLSLALGSRVILDLARRRAAARLARA